MPLDVQQNDINIVKITDPGYPLLLKEIVPAPDKLYYRGNLALTQQTCLAVVGTRKISNYGRAVLPGIIQPLIDAGLIIVSGLAFGIDALAHQTAVNAGRPTIAVLPSGLDDASIYPKQHVHLADQILAHGGLLISEYGNGYLPHPYSFVERNRLISGLSIGALIADCPMKSGALITARHALDQNRRVYAVPGPVYNANSVGPHWLIREGATLVTQAADIVTDLDLTPAMETNITPQEQSLLSLLRQQSQTLDTLIENSGQKAEQVSGLLTSLEIKGRVQRTGSQEYAACD